MWEKDDELNKIKLKYKAENLSENYSSGISVCVTLQFSVSLAGKCDMKIYISHNAR